MNLTSSDDGSMGMQENVLKLHNQDFEKLKEFYVEKNILFTDEYFPANMTSIGLLPKNEFNTNRIVWKRPKDICTNNEPCFTVDGMSLSDIMHSKRGKCWVLSAIGSITLKREALDKVVPNNQGFGKRYAGIFHFRLWHLGEWMDIVIDDRLPFLDGNYLYVQPSCEHEFWPCLLEKAYAKFLGSYERLYLADPAETFVNLTGGLTMTFDLKTTEAHDYWNMIRVASQDTMMACISDKQNPAWKNKNLRLMLYSGNLKNIFKKKPTENAHQDNDLGEKLPENALQRNGLVELHAYSITDYTEVLFRNRVEKLIRLWNPWGSGEWNGKWNDRCSSWNELKEEDRLKLQKIDDDDGEFWISWEDFISEFSKLIVCNQVPDFLDSGDQHKKWHKKMHRSRWTKENLSWNKIDKDFFNKNPLYRIMVPASDEGMCGKNVVISLMQDSKNRYEYGDWLPIGFKLFEFPDSQDKIPDLVLTPENIPSIDCLREHNIILEYEMKPGRYGIIPYTTQNEHESSFLLQVFLKSEGCTDDISLCQNLKGAVVPEHERIFKIYSNKDSKLYAWELKQLLNNKLMEEYSHKFNPEFTNEGCREILASVDTSKKARLSAKTFAELWEIITKYKDFFNTAAVNNCGYIDLPELRRIMKLAGLNVHNDLLQQLFSRYSEGQGKLHFVDYLVCTVRLNGMIKTFQKLFANGKATNMNVDKWLQLMM